MTEKTFMMACRDHFGKLNGQTLQEFSAELKALTDEDRADLRVDFLAIDIKITN